MLVLVGRGEDPLHPGIDQATERRLELREGVRVLELKQVQVPFCFVEVETVDTVVVSAEGDACYGVVTLDLELTLEVNEREVVIPDASARRLQVRGTPGGAFVR